MVIFSLSSSYGAMAAGHASGAGFASSGLAGVQAKATGTAPSDVPGFATDNPREASLDDGSIGGATSAAARSNEAALMLSEHSSTRQKFVIDPNTDPMVINANRASANPEKTMEEMVMETAEGKGEKDKIHECFEGGDEYPQTCRKHLVVKIQVTAASTVISHYERSNCDIIMRSPGYGGDSYCLRHNGSCPPDNVPVYVTTPRKVEIVSEEWVDGCGALEAVDEGRPETKIVTGNVVGTQTTDSEPIKRDSWVKTYTYACLKKVQGTCMPLLSKGCLQINSTCAEQIGGACVAWKQTFRCPSAKRKTTRYKTVGANSPFCLTGNCVDSDYEANGELLNAMSHLAILKEAQNDIRANVGIFKGQVRKCSKNCAGFRDCCTTGKGWGVSMNLSSCSGEEQELANWRAKKRCVFVGTYCAEKILGVCTRKKSSFCCFGNKLSKLLNDQGRRQLGIGFGEADAPNCRGLTPEELSRIDMSRMDLSELYEEVQANFKPPAQSHVAKGVELERIRENMTRLTGRVTGVEAASKSGMGGAGMPKAVSATGQMQSEGVRL